MFSFCYLMCTWQSNLETFSYYFTLLVQALLSQHQSYQAVSIRNVKRDQQAGWEQSDSSLIQAIKSSVKAALCSVCVCYVCEARLSLTDTISVTVSEGWCLQAVPLAALHHWKKKNLDYFFLLDKISHMRLLNPASVYER